MKRLELKLLMLSDSRAEREEEGKILFSYAKLRDAIFPRLFFATLHICNYRKRTRTLKQLQGGECHSRCAERLHFRPSFPPQVCSIVVRLSSTLPAPKGRAIEEEGGSHMLVLSPPPPSSFRFQEEIIGRRGKRARGEGGNGQEDLFQARGLWRGYELFFPYYFFSTSVWRQFSQLLALLLSRKDIAECRSLTPQFPFSLPPAIFLLP